MQTKREVGNQNSSSLRKQRQINKPKSMVIITLWTRRTFFVCLLSKRRNRSFSQLPNPQSAIVHPSCFFYTDTEKKKGGGTQTLRLLEFLQDYQSSIKFSSKLCIFCCIIRSSKHSPNCYYMAFKEKQYFLWASNFDKYPERHKNTGTNGTKSKHNT